MTRREKPPVDLADIRDEGLRHLDEIAANYIADIGISADDMKTYLSENISYAADGDMQKGMALYFELAAKNDLIDANKPLMFI